MKERTRYVCARAPKMCRNGQRRRERCTRKVRGKVEELGLRERKPYLLREAFQYAQSSCSGDHCSIRKEAIARTLNCRHREWEAPASPSPQEMLLSLLIWYRVPSPGNRCNRERRSSRDKPVRRGQIKLFALRRSDSIKCKADEGTGFRKRR